MFLAVIHQPINVMEPPEKLRLFVEILRIYCIMLSMESEYFEQSRVGRTKSTTKSRLIPALLCAIPIIIKSEVIFMQHTKRTPRNALAIPQKML